MSGAGYTTALAQVGEGPPMRPFGERDHPNALFGMMTLDCAWHMPGRNVLSGDFIGREAILGSFATLQANVDAYWAWPLDYFGSDDHVVLVAQVKAERGTKRLDCLECLLWRVDAKGKLAEVWHMALDEKAWDAFFSHA